MEVKRIGYVINVFPKLSETFIAIEIAELLKRSLDILIISLRHPTETLRHTILETAGLLQRTIYAPDSFLPALKNFGPDLLHAHFATEPTAAAREFSRVLQVPFTFTAHGYDIHRKPPPDFDARAADASAIITVSRANAAYIQKTFAVPNAKIRVIPCGVDTNIFKPALAAESDPPLVLCVARHVVVKNIGLLLQALALLHQQNVPFKAVLIGDGPCRGELEELSQDLMLTGIVEFVGAATQDQVLPWLQRARVAVLTSENEGMPVSLMEAAACGVPVVATAVGGIPELVKDGVTGFLAPLEPAAFANKLRLLLEDQTLARKMGVAARSEALERFSVRHQADALLSLWNSILACPK